MSRRPYVMVCCLGAAALLSARVNGWQESKPPEVRTLTYATRNGVDLLLDLYLPAVPIRRPVPVIVFLHGGGWSGGTRTTGPDFNATSRRTDSRWRRSSTA